MKIPRDCNGKELVKALRRFGYAVDRQTGSHIMLTTRKQGEHHVSVPNHRPLKIGMLRAILKVVAEHHKMSIEELLAELKL